MQDKDEAIPSILEHDGSSKEFRKNWARLTQKKGNGMIKFRDSSAYSQHNLNRAYNIVIFDLSHFLCLLPV